MAIVAGFDVHRAQITFDALDQQTGEVSRARIPVCCTPFRRGRGGAPAPSSTSRSRRALAGCSCAEPVETSALRGKKRRAKTAREDPR
jgi:hypothetical protein